MPSSAAKRLLDHYDATARALPWRSPPGAPPPDPYPIWLSEVMLQQTNVATVIPRFVRFISRWPTVEALAAADEAELMGEWAGLGYYARARHLHACARKVAALGAFPASARELRQLPGIGDYSAAAIAAIAFGEQVAVVDTNVARVAARLAGIDRPLAEARAEVRAIVEAMTPDDRPGDFAQAMMDLGAAICRPRQPRCDACPLSAGCAAFASGSPERFPAPRIRRDRPHRVGEAWWIERGGALWLVRRPASGLLGGMAALPGGEWGERVALPAAPLAVVRHLFTHFTLELAVTARAEPPDGDGWWQPLATIGHAGLPTLYRVAVEAVLAGRGRLAA